MILFAFCLSGSSALIYEVSWTRTLTLTLGSTVYAVSTMLSTFMTGLALGGFIGGVVSDKTKNALFLFAVIQLLIGMTGLMTLLLFNFLPPLYYWLYKSFHFSFTLYMVFQFFICALFMLLPTTLMGATFPLLSKVLTRGLDAVGKNIGSLYSINNVGAIAGSLSAGFLFIPFLGIKKTILIAACLNFLAGALILLITQRVSAAKRLVPVVLCLTAAPFLLRSTATPSLFLFNFYHASRYKKYSEFQKEVKRYELVFEQEDLHGPVSVFHDPERKVYYIQNSGKVEGSTGQDTATQTLLAILPLATKPDAESFLGIGLGTGMTAWEAVKKVKQVDWLEINSSVVRASQKIFYPELPKKINLILDDGRHYLTITEKKYDVISSEPSYPTEPTTANLFTVEFYKTASKKLSAHGVFCQWVPYFVLTNDNMDMLIHTFTSVFPYTFIWEVPESGDFLFVGSPKRIPQNTEKILTRIKTMQQKSSNRFTPRIIYSQEQVVKILQDMKKRNIPLNTDDRPVLEFAVAKNLLKGSENLK